MSTKHNIEISEDGMCVRLDGKQILNGDIDVSVCDYRGQERQPIVKLELWYEEIDGPQIRTHFVSGMKFEDVRQKMIALRDRLTAEIEKGPQCCPFAKLQNVT